MSLQSLGKDRADMNNKNVTNHPNMMGDDGAVGSAPVATPLSFTAGPQNTAAANRRVPPAPRDGSFLGLR